MHLLQRTKRRVASYSLAIEDGAKTEYDYQRCCHCQKHLRIIPGSGTIRGFCQRCNDVTCGKQGCQPCVPFQRRMDKEAAAIRQAIQRDRVRSALFEMLGLQP